MMDAYFDDEKEFWRLINMVDNNTSQDTKMLSQQQKKVSLTVYNGLKRIWPLQRKSWLLLRKTWLHPMKK